MKKILFMGVMGLFLLGSCNSKSGDGHEGHNHETEKHEHEGCDHDHEGEDHNHEGGEHNHDGHSHDGKAAADIVTKSFCLPPKHRLPE